MPLRLANLFAFILLWANYANIQAQTYTEQENNIKLINEQIKAYFSENRKNNRNALLIEFLRQNDIKDSSEIHYALGYLSFFQQNYLAAVNHYLLANEHLKRSNNARLNAEVLFQLANSYQRLFFLNKAIDYYKITLKDFSRHLQPERKNKIIIDIGNSFFDLDRYDSAQVYYCAGLNNSTKIGDNLHQTIALINIGNLNMVQGKYTVADSINKKALALSKIYKHEYLEVMCKFNRGELNFITHDYGTARNLLNQVLKKAEEVNLKRLIPNTYKYFVLIEFEEKKFKRAIDYSTKFYKSSSNFESREKKIKAIKEVNDVLQELDFLKTAEENLAKNNKLLDSILFKEVEERSQLMESMQQLTELQGSYKDLAAENDLKEEKLLRSRIAFALVVLILLITTLFIGLLFRSRNKIKKQNTTIHKQFQDIKKKNLETEELNHEVNMQSEEIRVQNDQLLANQRELEKRISERTKDLEAALKRAEESDKLKSSFLQNLSHEIRTPLNAISGFAQLITREKNINTEFTEIISLNVHDLIDIIDNIILYSTLQAGQYQSSVSLTPIFSIINQLQGDFGVIKKKYKRKSIELKINNQVDNEIALKTDVSLFQKMLVQLIENAFKFTEEGSVTLDVKENENGIRFSVTDTGIGIKKEKIPYIFDTFRKLESEKVFRGTGIGLALVKKIAELLKGEISITSEFGIGTSIYIDISYYKRLK